MQHFADPGLAFGSLSWGKRPGQLAATFIVKQTFRLSAAGPPVASDEPAFLSGELASDDGSIVYTSDFVPYKPRADVLLIGSAHAPGSTLVRALRVSLRVGTLTKSLAVVGDRPRRAVTGDAQPAAFIVMPLTGARVLGDADRLPNIEHFDAQAASQSPDANPPGFAPLADTSPTRTVLAGTYDQTWLKQGWPWFPSDFDWEYFNAAPLDQRLAGHLVGDEVLAFENLNSQHPLYRTRLPALRARVFVERQRADGALVFAEVAMQLDTLTILPNDESCTLVWRGLTAARSLKLREFKRAFAFLEPLAEAERSMPEHHAFVERRFLQTEAPIPKSVDDPAEAAAQQLAVAKTMTEVNQRLEEAEAILANAEAKLAALAERQQQAAAALGIAAPDLVEAAPAGTSQSIKAGRTVLQTYKAALAQRQPKAPGTEVPALSVLDEADAELAAIEADLVEVEQAAQPEPATSGWTRERVAAALLTRPQCGALLAQDLSGLDLSALDFSAADLTGSRLVGTSFTGARMPGALLAHTDLTRADLTGADLTGAVLTAADLTGALLNGACFADAQIGDAVMSAQALAGADFSRCTGHAVDFSLTDLSGARFSDARLPRADFSGARLHDAVFDGAALQAAQFDGADAAGISMRGADLNGLHASGGANFSRAALQGVRAEGSIWEASILDGADFSQARLKRSQFSNASLRATRFDDATLQHAVFDDAVLRHAFLRRANCLRVSFERADLSFADARASNFFEAGFWDATLHNTLLDLSDVGSTLLSLRDATA
jgi:uncharacterized protein YjbI with pentapeptide repeats